jgi:hypothetical protein
LLIVLNLTVPLANRLPATYHRTGGMGFFLLGAFLVGILLRELASYYLYVITEENFEIKKCWGKRRKRVVLHLKFDDIVHYGPLKEAPEMESRHARRYRRSWKKDDQYALDFLVDQDRRRVVIQNTPRIERVMARMLKGSFQR